MMAYSVHNLDHKGDANTVRCSCGHAVFTTPEPPTDPFFTGRFNCAQCGFRWSTENIVQRVAFVEV